MKKKILLLWGILCMFACACVRQEDSLGERFINHLKNPGNASKITLNEMADFHWDSMYYFMPYTDKEIVEEAIGFSADEISDNLSSDDGVYLLFVKGKEIVCQVRGIPENFGFRFDFGKMDSYVKIDEKERSLFSIEKEGKVVTYTLKE